MCEQATNYFSRPDLEFISYDGEPLHLCRGILTLRDKNSGKVYKLENVLQSGGSCVHKSDYDSEILQGPWCVEDDRLPYELQPYVDEITALVNENIMPGCCGGCS